MLVAPEPQIRAEMLLTAAKITFIWIYIFEVVDLFEVAMTCVYRLKKSKRKNKYMDCKSIFLSGKKTSDWLTNVSLESWLTHFYHSKMA